MKALAWVSAVIALGGLVGGCVANRYPPAADAAHNSQNSLSWAGTYSGVLPCADCEGIETNVSLHYDGSYAVTTRYLGRDAPAFHDEGKFVWNKAGSEITFSGRDPARYRVEENRLVRLALDGSTVTGALASHYILNKDTRSIAEKRWKLVELGGQAVPAMDRDVHFTLRVDGSRVEGFGGCNTFRGTYSMDKDAAQIRFGPLATTRMACPPNVNVETDFLSALADTRFFDAHGDELTLRSEQMTPLARLQALYLQ